MPTGSAIAPNLTRLVRMRGLALQGKTTWRVVPDLRSPEDAETGEYESYEAGTFLQDTPAATTRQYIRPVKAPYLSFDHSIASGDYTLEEIYAYKEEDHRETNNSSGMRRWNRMAVATSNRFETAMEVVFRDALWNATNFTSGAWAAANQFQLATGDPFRETRRQWDLIEVASAIMSPEAQRHIWMNPIAFNHLVSHARLTKYFGSDGEATDRGTRRMVASELEVPEANLHVAGMVINSAAPGATPVNARVWAAASMWMGFLPPSISEGDQTAMARIWANAGDASVTRGEVELGNQHYRWVRQSLIAGFAAPDNTYGRHFTTVYV